MQHKKIANYQNQLISFILWLLPDLPILIFHINPIALRKAKTVCNFGISECDRVNKYLLISVHINLRQNSEIPDKGEK